MELDDASRWHGPTNGLALFLNGLRARIALWILASAALLAAYASAPSRVAIVGAVLGALGAAIGVVMLVGLVRHAFLPRPRRGRWLALAAGAAILTAVALAVRALWLAPLALSAVLLAELVAFSAVCPLMASHARLAASLDAPELSRRAWRACGLSAITTGAIVALAYGWPLYAGKWFRPTLAGGAALLLVLAVAKAVGVARFLLAYLRHMHAARFSASPAELRAWHRA